MIFLPHYSYFFFFAILSETYSCKIYSKLIIPSFSKDKRSQLSFFFAFWNSKKKVKIVSYKQNSEREKKKTEMCDINSEFIEKKLSKLWDVNTEFGENKSKLWYTNLKPFFALHDRSKLPYFSLHFFLKHFPQTKWIILVLFFIQSIIFFLIIYFHFKICHAVEIKSIVNVFHD